MKRRYLAFLIILMGFLMGIVRAENNIFISEVSMIEKSNDVTVNKEPVKNGLTIDFDLKFKNVGDSIKYKVLILNRDTEDYTLSSSDRNENGYIKYEYVYENNNKVVVAGGEKVMYIIITYNKPIPNELYKDGKYNETHSTNLSFYNNRLPMEEMKKIDNPKTSSASIVFITLAILLSLVISFLLSSRKMRRYLGVFIIGAILISPFVVYAVSNIFITVNTKIEIEKEYKMCNYSFEHFEYSETEYLANEKWNDYYTRINNSVDYSYLYFYSKEVIDCYINYNNEYRSKGLEDSQKLEACNTLRTNESTNNRVSAEDLIKGKEEGCYHLEVG